MSDDCCWTDKTLEEPLVTGTLFYFWFIMLSFIKIHHKLALLQNLRFWTKTQEINKPISKQDPTVTALKCTPILKCYKYTCTEFIESLDQSLKIMLLYM